MEYLSIASFLLLISFVGLGYFVFGFLFIGNIYRLKYDTQIITPTQRMEERNEFNMARELMSAELKIEKARREELENLYSEVKKENEALSKQVEKLVIARVK